MHPEDKLALLAGFFTAAAIMAIIGIPYAAYLATGIGAGYFITEWQKEKNRGKKK